IHETKMLQVDLWMLRHIWGNVHFDFASTSARGLSGGIICLWNSLVFRLVLEKGIPKHHPILLKESIVDYGPTPFWFFHSWLEMDGFHDLVIRVWIASQKADTYVLKKEHHHRLSIIDSKINQGYVSEEDFMTQHDSLSILGDMDRLEAKDYAQKPKIKWALEGDKNTSFFHGTLKEKRSPLALLLSSIRCLSTLYPKLIDIIKEDVVYFIQEFSTSHEIRKGCNPSFIALILKVPNAKFVYDFRPISLIGCQYKIIAKILANRLSNVIGDCVSPIQSAFIKGRYILDGSLILNEILVEYRHQHKELLLFKVDFEQAFDSVR
nr:RNA-directed DNA polymerase, eukaryota, reverse transcriptase zinc-binding domain protein [Tanacetum cinerariifolium]